MQSGSFLQAFAIASNFSVQSSPLRVRNMQRFAVGVNAHLHAMAVELHLACTQPAPDGRTVIEFGQLRFDKALGIDGERV